LGIPSIDLDKGANKISNWSTSNIIEQPLQQMELSQFQFSLKSMNGVTLKQVP